MIKQMRRRFLIVSMSSFIFVLCSLLIGLNALYFYQTIRDVDITAERINQNALQALGESQPNDLTPPTPPKDTGFNLANLWQRNPQHDREFANYFLIKTASDGTIEETDIDHSFNLSTNDANNLASTALASSTVQGWASQFRYQRFNLSTGYLWVFIDTSRQLQSITRLAVVSGIILIFSLLIVYGLLSFLSKRAIQPLIDNIQRQREFINNASHEIKTPLAVLATNNDILEMTGQANEWTASNRRQIMRLNQLVEQMLLLARYDEGATTLKPQRLDLSRHLTRQLADLDSLIQETGHTLKLDIPSPCEVTVDQATFSQLMQALLENALKYHIGDSQIILRWDANHHRLSLINHCEAMSEQERQQLFDRFYRRDASRNREQGGSGMGLSIAKALAELNHLELEAELLTASQIAFHLTFKQ